MAKLHNYVDYFVDVSLFQKYSCAVMTTHDTDPFNLEWEELSLHDALSVSFPANENADTLRSMLTKVEVARARGMYEPIQSMHDCNCSSYHRST